jgi:hypothetical protein
MASPTAAIPRPTAPMTIPNPPITFMRSSTSLIHLRWMQSPNASPSRYATSRARRPPFDPLRQDPRSPHSALDDSPAVAATAECVNAIARNRGLRHIPVRRLEKARAILLWFALAHCDDGAVATAGRRCA